MASSSESSIHSVSASSNPFWSAVFESNSPRHATFRHQASTSSGEFLEPPSPCIEANKDQLLGQSSWPQQIDAAELQQLDIIGSGGCGLVFRGRWGGKLVAIKQINQGSLRTPGSGREGGSFHMSTEAWLQRFYNEAQTIWMARDHPNVVQLLGLCLQRYWLVFEYCAGGGLDFVIARCRLAPAVIVEWATQIASGMEWLHSVGIIHRDLKSCNILLKYPLPQLQISDAISEVDSWPNESEDDLAMQQQKPVILKIADFGLARQLSLDKSRVTAKYAEGTVRYLAPEVITSRTYSKASDVWSYGVVFWEILTGEQPYRDVEECAVMFRVGRQLRSLLPIPPSCPPAFAALLTDCWESDPFKRPTFSEIVDRLSLSDVSVAEFTRTGTEFSSLQDSWRQIIDNAFEELRVRQGELELADLALRERAAQQQLIDSRLRQWEKQLAQRELRVVERELRTLFSDDQYARSSGSFSRRRRRSTNDTHFSLPSFLSPRPSARLRPPHRVTLSHIRHDRSLISRPLVASVVQASRNTSISQTPSIRTAHSTPRMSNSEAVASDALSKPDSNNNDDQILNDKWSSQPKKSSRVRQALSGAARLLAAVLIGYDPAGPKPPQIPLIHTDDNSVESGAMFNSHDIPPCDVTLSPMQHRFSSPNVLTAPTQPQHLFYVGSAKQLSASTDGLNSPNDKNPHNFLQPIPIPPPLATPEECHRSPVSNSRPEKLSFSPHNHHLSNGPRENGIDRVFNTAAHSTDSGMALSSVSLGSMLSGGATTPVDVASRARSSQQLPFTSLSRSEAIAK